MVRQAGIAAALAAGAVLLGGAPASACGDSASGAQVSQYQVGAKLGPAVGVTGTLEQQDVTGTDLSVADPRNGVQVGVAQGQIPEWIFLAVPSGGIALEDADGRALVSVDAMGATASAPTLRKDLNAVEAFGSKSDKVNAKTPAVAAPARPAPSHSVVAPAPVVDQAAAALPAETEVPLATNSSPWALGGDWVPLQSIGGSLGGSDGLPWLSGLAVLTLATAAGSLTLVARRH